MNNFPKSIIRNIGVSNCYKPHLQRLLSVCQKYGLSPPMFNEVESNLLYPNDETIHFCQENHIQVIAYSPLGYNMAKFLTNPTLQQSNPVLIEAASTLNASLAQTALAWHMAKGVAVIPKSTNIHRLKENFEATQFISSITSDLTDQLKTLEAGPAFGDAVTDVAQNAYDCAQRLTWSVEQTSALDIIESSPLFASTQRTINASQIIEKTKDDKTP
jgi:diketogulonate reductase-like aldo/keto reductase